MLYSSDRVDQEKPHRPYLRAYKHEKLSDDGGPIWLEYTQTCNVFTKTQNRRPVFEGENKMGERLCYTEVAKVTKVTRAKVKQQVTGRPLAYCVPSENQPSLST